MCVGVCMCVCVCVCARVRTHMSGYIYMKVESTIVLRQFHELE